MESPVEPLLKAWIVATAMSFVSWAGVYEYQTVWEAGLHGQGSPASIVASVMVTVSE
jgi:hypothetical protein